MIAMAPVPSTPPSSAPPSPDRAFRVSRRAVLGAVALGSLTLGGCVAEMAPAGPDVEPPRMDSDVFVMPDGARLPFRAWLPEGEPEVAMLALHGINDSRDAWEFPAPLLSAHGVALYGPDQRGFGQAPGRGLWPGTRRLVEDAAAMARLVAARHPGVPLVLLGESMGGAVLMVLAASPLAPPGARYVLSAPAVWGRARMNWALQGILWLARHTLPGLVIGPGPLRVTASDNREALIRLSTDPLSLHSSRIDVVAGLVDLMDAALAAAPRQPGPALFLYGGHDELVPPAATRATWEALPAGRGIVRSYYPEGYHLLLRDLGRAATLADILSWVAAPARPLPSGGEARAAAWLAAQA